MATGDEIEDMKRKFQEEISEWQKKFEDLQCKVDQACAEKPCGKANSSIIQDDSSEVLNNIKKTCDDANKGLSVMKEKWSTCLEDLSERLLEQDQYSKKDNLLLRGFKNLPNLYGLDFIYFIADYINFLFPSLRGMVRPIHINDAHPLKTKRGNNNVVIIKFCNRWVKHDILRCEEDLIGSPFSVTEHLTHHTLKLRSLAGNLVGRENVWTFKTKVYAAHNGMKYVIRKLNDLKSLETIILNTASSSSNDGAPCTPANVQLNTTNNSVQSAQNIRHEAVIDRSKYILNYPSLYDSLTVHNDNNSQPFRGTTMRGKPSRNGRGRRR